MSFVSVMECMSGVEGKGLFSLADERFYRRRVTKRSDHVSEREACKGKIHLGGPINCTCLCYYGAVKHELGGSRMLEARENGWSGAVRSRRREERENGRSSFYEEGTRPMSASDSKSQRFERDTGISKASSFR